MFVLGGVTQMEVSALRLVSDRLPVDITVGGSCLLSGSEVLRSVIGRQFDGASAVQDVGGLLSHAERQIALNPPAEGDGEVEMSHKMAAMHERLDDLRSLATEDPNDVET